MNATFTYILSEKDKDLIKNYQNAIIKSELKEHLKRDILDYTLDEINKKMTVTVRDVTKYTAKKISCKINSVITYFRDMQILQNNNININDSIFKKEKEKILEEYKDTICEKNGLLWPRDKYAIINAIIDELKLS